jgi:hypothetical protein
MGDVVRNQQVEVLKLLVAGLRGIEAYEASSILASKTPAAKQQLRNLISNRLTRAIRDTNMRPICKLPNGVLICEQHDDEGFDHPRASR